MFEEMNGPPVVFMEISSNQSGGDSSSYSSSPFPASPYSLVLSPIKEELSPSLQCCYVAPPSCYELREAEKKITRLETKVANLENELQESTIKSLKFEFNCKSLKEEKGVWEEEKQTMEEEKRAREKKISFLERRLTMEKWQGRGRNLGMM